MIISGAGRTDTSSFFSNSANFTVSGGTFNVASGNYVQNINDSGDKEWIRLLRYNTASGAFHDSGERYDAPKCHPHTREAVIKEIMEWIMDESQPGQLLWIYGPAGSGKSSIAQTISEMCDDQGILASDYFFARTAPGRNNSTNLVPTLAYQLMTYNRRVRKYIAEAITLDNLVFSRSLEAQFEALILRPLTQAVAQRASSNPGANGRYPDPYLIVIDGLDECSPPESQRYILTSLTTALNKVPVPLLFLIASRPDRVIRDEFNGDLSSRTRRVVLDNKYQPDGDIETYLKSKFGEIKHKHPLATTLPPDWPSDHDIAYLVQKAAGQFIYASTVTKFVESPQDRPKERLDMILNLTPTGNNTPFADLDEVYKNILLSIEKSKLESALTVFAFLFAASRMNFSPYISSYDAAMLQTAAFIELFLGNKPYDLLLVLGDLHSLVDVPPISASSNLAGIRLFHPSFSEYLQDRGRAEPNLFVDMGLYCVKFAQVCIGHLTPWLYTEDANFPNSSAMIQYSFRLFLQLFSTASPDDDLLRELSQFPIDLFFKHMFDGWVPVFSLVPLLLGWIEKQNIEIYNIYNSHYTAAIKNRLLSKPLSVQPRWQYILTATTLNITNTRKFSKACRLFVSGSKANPAEAMLIQEHLFGEMNFLLESLDTNDYLSRLKALLLDPSASEMHHIDHLKYFGLAVELFDMFTGKASKSNILDDLSNEQDVIVGIFYATLDRIPGDLSLGRYLRSNRGRDFVSFFKLGSGFMETKVRSRIDGYIQKCGNLSDENLSLQASGSMSIPAPIRTNLLFVPSKISAASSREPSLASSQDETTLQRSIEPSLASVPISPHTPNLGGQGPSSAHGSLSSTSKRGLRNKGKEILRKMFH